MHPSQWLIYNWTDTGYVILIYVTPVTLWLWMLYLLEQCWVTVWEASCCSCSSWEWQASRMDCDSSHCGFGPGLFLPPGSRCSCSPESVHTVPPQRLYACSLGVRMKRWSCELCRKMFTTLFVMYSFSGLSTHQEEGDIDRSRRLTGHTLVHPSFEQKQAISWIPMQHWFPGFGDRKWD